MSLASHSFGYWGRDFVHGHICPPWCDKGRQPESYRLRKYIRKSRELAKDDQAKKLLLRDCDQD